MIKNNATEALRKLIRKKQIKELKGVHEFVKELTAGTVQALLDEELDDELVYGKYDYQSKQTDNSRKGHLKKDFKQQFRQF